MSIENQSGYCLQGCTPVQVLQLDYAINDITTLKVYNECGDQYDMTSLQYSYSLDGACWTCFMDYDDALEATIELSQDFYLKVKIQGYINSVTLDDESTTDYTTSLDSEFTFSCSDTSSSTSNLYNPYSGLSGALSLQTTLTETVSCMFGIPVYYFKLSHNAKSKDLTFKEYTLNDIEAVKQIKLIISDGAMPSSKPTFDDLGLGWESDWTTEISKNTFATAFGDTAFPMEGDLVYIPLMKRMWMVNGAYEEKKDSLMWNATTIQVVLVKYQEKDSVDLGDTQELVDNLVKNKYEDLFGDPRDNENLGSGEIFTEAPRYAANTLYPVFESDATRAYVTCDTLQIDNNTSTYFKGTLISDFVYRFNNATQSKIIYQKKYCGDEGSVSFLIYPNITSEIESNIVNIGNICIKLVQQVSKVELTVNVEPKLSISLDAGSIYFVTLRWSKSLNICDFIAYLYTYDQRIPQYKLQNNHYYYDIDNPYSKAVTKFNQEFIVTDESEVSIEGLDGWMTNFKLFRMYDTNISEMLQTYPTNSQLLINDTARKIVDLSGVATN